MIPSLWPELLESTGRSKNAARVIFQYLNIFSERELIEELIDAGYNSTDWKDHFNLADTLSSLLQQIEPSGRRRCSLKRLDTTTRLKSGMMRNPTICFIVTYSVMIIIRFLDERIGFKGENNII